MSLIQNISLTEARLANLPIEVLESLLQDDILSYEERKTVKAIMNKRELTRKIRFIEEVHKAAITYPSPTSAKPRYRTYVEVVDPKTGKKRRKEISKTHEEEFFDTLYFFYSSGRLPTKDDQRVYTLESLYPEWLEYKRLHSGAETNVERVERTWRRFYQSAPIIKTELKRLTVLQIDTWLHDQIHRYGMTRKQFNNFSLILRQMLEYAMLKELIEKNPLTHVKVESRLFKRESKPDPEKEVFTKLEEQSIIAHAWDDYRTNTRLLKPLASLAVAFQFQTGLRVGELCALKYSDIVEDRLHVQRMVRKQTVVVEHTKSRAGDRMVYLTTKAWEIINETLRYHKEHGEKAEFIFGGNTALKPRTIDDRYRSFCKTLGILHRSSHKARKTQISSLIDGGISLDTVRRLAGHEDSETTLRCYHFDRAEEKERKAKIEAILNGT